MCGQPKASQPVEEHDRPIPNAGGSSLLLAGASGSFLFVASSLIQGALREGFDFNQHPPSALSLGSVGFLQQATFVVSGLLLTLGAFGLRRRSISRWAPRTLGALGLCLAAAGLFSMDPAFGFPPGTPPGVGETVSWHAAVHGALFPLGFAALVGTALILARHYHHAQRGVMEATAIGVAVVSLVLSMWPNLAADPDGRFLPMWLGVTIAYLWIGLMQVDIAFGDRLDKPM